MANIDAMELAIHEASTVERFSVGEILAIHHRLMEAAPNAHVAGRLRSSHPSRRQGARGTPWRPDPPSVILPA